MCLSLPSVSVTGLLRIHELKVWRGWELRIYRVGIEDLKIGWGRGVVELESFASLAEYIGSYPTGDLTYGFSLPTAQSPTGFLNLREIVVLYVNPVD
jgi:hypothetical protein